jgi:hypothetical protein
MRAIIEILKDFWTALEVTAFVVGFKPADDDEKEIDRP